MTAFDDKVKIFFARSLQLDVFTMRLEFECIGDEAIFRHSESRNLRYEEVYLHAYEGVAAARAGLGRYFRFYNAERRHQGLGRRTPDAVYADSGSWPKAA